MTVDKNIGSEINAAKASKKPVKLRVKGDFLSPDRALNLADQTRAALARQWLEENRSEIYNYNMRIERCGVFSDGLRRF